MSSVEAKSDIYFSKLFREWYPEIAGKVFRTLTKYNISYNEIENTKDIWCRDYLPVSGLKGRMVQFIYDPSYLRVKKYRHLRTEPSEIIDQLPIEKPDTSSLILDGGQVVKGKKNIIVSKRVVAWNKNSDEFGTTDKVRNELEEKLEVEAENLILLQPQPFDFTGHVDGLVRFVDDGTVLISDFSREEKWYKESIQGTLHNKKLEYKLMPVAYEYSSLNQDSAVGIYMNYLQVNDLIIFPIFNKREDEEAYRIIRNTFPSYSIETVDCRDLAEEGGILNCVSWSI